MPTLYDLSLWHKKPTFVAGPVKAVPAVYCGHYRDAERDIMRPCPDSVRECLPHYYRRAYDRTSKNFWFPRDGDGLAYLTLYDARGRYLNTIYARPYDFNPGTPT